MKTELFTILAIMVISSLALIVTVSAQTAVAGVFIGETFDYDYKLLWDSTNPSASPPAFFVNLNQTEQVQIRISDVSGSIVNTTVTKQFKNGTQIVEAGYVDVSNGVVQAPFGYFIVSSNLSAGQRLYPSGGHQTITSTYLKSYATGERETNLYLIQTETGSERTEINFDKIKGIAVDYSYQTVETSGGYTTTIQEILTNTNSDVWTAIPELSTLLIPLTLFVATAALLVARTAKKRRNL